VLLKLVSMLRLGGCTSEEAAKEVDEGKDYMVVKVSGLIVPKPMDRSVDEAEVLESAAIPENVEELDEIKMLDVGEGRSEAAVKPASDYHVRDTCRTELAPRSRDMSLYSQSHPSSRETASKSSLSLYFADELSRVPRVVAETNGLSIASLNCAEREKHGAHP
jgi:hypothetical protein